MPVSGTGCTTWGHSSAGVAGITAVQHQQPQENRAVLAAALCCVWKVAGRSTTDLSCLNLLVFKVMLSSGHVLRCKS